MKKIYLIQEGYADHNENQHFYTLGAWEDFYEAKNKVTSLCEEQNIEVDEVEEFPDGEIQYRQVGWGTFTLYRILPVEINKKL
jgi:hypothetical protein